MTNNQINYWKVESERQKWQTEANIAQQNVDVARQNAETQRRSQIEQARHNLIDEELKRAINDAEIEYKAAMVQIDREYKQRMSRIEQQKANTQARQVEFNRIFSNMERIETARHNVETESARNKEVSSIVSLNAAKERETNAKAEKAEFDAKVAPYAFVINNTIDAVNAGANVAKAVGSFSRIF